MRLLSIDRLRGLAIVLMTLDHARLTFGPNLDPTDLDEAPPLLFFTRWVTHFCAPAFVYLAGVSAYLSASRFPASPARHLLARGLVLIGIDLLVMPFAWDLHYPPQELIFGVLWAIGWSMIAGAFLFRLSPMRLLVLSVAILALHNAFDPFDERWVHHPAYGWFWSFLHAPHHYTIAQHFGLDLLYPVLPWVAVMSVGYASAPFLFAESKHPRRRFFKLALLLALAFLALRMTRTYGDPRLWSASADPLRSAMSFLNCTKYPPSLLFLLMTFALLFLGFGLISNRPGRFAFLETFGRASLFYYLAHIFLLTLLYKSLLTLRAATGWRVNFARYDLSMTLSYVAAPLVCALLFYPCRWYTRLRRRSAFAPWLKYL